MSRFHVAKIILGMLACFSTATLANVLNNDPASSQISTSPHKAPKNIPTPVSNNRGQLLYENHCTVCHDSSAHIRERSKARSLADIRQWVYRWSQQLNLEWTWAEINDVADFLNQRFYQYPSADVNSD